MKRSENEHKNVLKFTVLHLFGRCKKEAITLSFGIHFDKTESILRLSSLKSEIKIQSA